MSVGADLTTLRAQWKAAGRIPPDACGQIVAAVSRHISVEQAKARRFRTPNEGEWCALCGVPIDSHKLVAPACPGEFAPGVEPVVPREPGEDG